VELEPAEDGLAPPPIELLADCGPTCFLEVEFPAGLAPKDFDAALLSGRPFQAYPYLRPPNSASLRAPDAATRHPKLPWVRFGSPGMSGPSFVELRSKDARWRGGNWIPESIGIQEPVKIELTSASWLVAQVALESGGEEGAQFELVESLPEGSKQRPRVHGAWARSTRYFPAITSPTATGVNDMAPPR
jgi:hypothetical protein